MIRTLGFTILLILTGVGISEAQCPPSANQTYNAPIQVNSNLEFCSTVNTGAPKVSLDGKELWQLASMNCRPVSNYFMCAFPLTQFIVDYLNNTKGTHTIQLTLANLTSPDSIVTVITAPKMCDYLPPNQTTPQKRPVGDIVEGNNPWPQGKRVSELENGGYEVFISAINSSQAHLIAICKGL